MRVLLHDVIRIANLVIVCYIYSIYSQNKSRNRAMCHALNFTDTNINFSTYKFCQLHRQFNVIFLHRFILYNLGEKCYNFIAKWNAIVIFHNWDVRITQWNFITILPSDSFVNSPDILFYWNSTHNTTMIRISLCLCSGIAKKSNNTGMAHFFQWVLIWFIYAGQ